MVLQPWEVDNLEDGFRDSTGVILGCYDCKELIVFGAERCTNCNTTYPDQFWREYGHLVQAEDGQEDHNSLKPNEIAFDARLCCNQLPEACTCIHPIEWEETYEIPVEINDKIYQPGAVCESCWHFWTSSCIPYRNFAFDFLVTGEVKKSIDGCIYFADDGSLGGN